MSLAEFMACAEGWQRANGSSPKPEAPSYDDHMKMRERYAKR